MNSHPSELKIFLSFVREEKPSDRAPSEKDLKLFNDQLRERFSDLQMSDYTVESSPGGTINGKIYEQLRGCYTLLALIQNAPEYFKRRACVFELFAFILARPEYLSMASLEDNDVETRFHPTNFINVVGAPGLRGNKTFKKNWNLLVGWFHWIQSKFRSLPPADIQKEAARYMQILVKCESATDILNTVKSNIGNQGAEASRFLSKKDAPAVVSLEDCDKELRCRWKQTLGIRETALANMPLIIHFTCAPDPLGASIEDYQHLTHSHETFDLSWFERNNMKKGAVCLFELRDERCVPQLRGHFIRMINVDNLKYIIRLRGDFNQAVVLLARKSKTSMFKCHASAISSMGLELALDKRKVQIIGSNAGELRRALQATGIFSSPTEESSKNKILTGNPTTTSL